MGSTSIKRRSDQLQLFAKLNGRYETPKVIFIVKLKNIFKWTTGALLLGLILWVFIAYWTSTALPQLRVTL
jgi:hypothetical protein